MFLYNGEYKELFYDKWIVFFYYYKRKNRKCYLICIEFLREFNFYINYLS